MSIYGVYKLDEVEKIALQFSNDNNIVESTIWANLKVENGLDGGGIFGSKRTLAQRQNQSKAAYNRSPETKIMYGNLKRGIPLSTAHKNAQKKARENMSEATYTQMKQKMSVARRRNNSGNKKEIHIFDNNQVLVVVCIGNFKKKCEELQLPYKALLKSYQQNAKPIYETTQSKLQIRNTPLEKFTGYYARIV